MADGYTNGFDRWMGETFRPFAKVWFEVLRNLFVVALLSYVANKSTYSTLKLLSFFTTGLFWLYAISYFTQMMPVKSNATNVYVRGVMNIVISAICMFNFYSWSNIIFTSLDEVMKSQSH